MQKNVQDGQAVKLALSECVCILCIADECIDCIICISAASDLTAALINPFLIKSLHFTATPPPPSSASVMGMDEINQ